MLILGLVVSLSAAAATAGEPGDFWGVERRVLAAGRPGAQELGGSDIGAPRAPDRDKGAPRDTGRRLTAGLLSLVLPGAGQYYNGDRGKALMFAGTEAAIWTAWLVFDAQGDGKVEDYQEYAHFFAGVDGEHPEIYWRALGRYLDSDAYNNDLRMEARAEGREPTGLVGEEDAWQWRNERYQENYKSLRADANRAYDRRDFTTLFAIVNRVVAVFDAVRGAGRDHLVSVAGLGIDLRPAGDLRDPGTACVFSTHF